MCYTSVRLPRSSPALILSLRSSRYFLTDFDSWPFAIGSVSFLLQGPFCLHSFPQPLSLICCVLSPFFAVTISGKESKALGNRSLCAVFILNYEKGSYKQLRHVLSKSVFFSTSEIPSSLTFLFHPPPLSDHLARTSALVNEMSLSLLKFLRLILLSLLPLLILSPLNNTPPPLLRETPAFLSHLFSIPLLSLSLPILMCLCVIICTEEEDEEDEEEEEDGSANICLRLRSLDR